MGERDRRPHRALISNTDQHRRLPERPICRPPVIGFDSNRWWLVAMTWFLLFGIALYVSADRTRLIRCLNVPLRADFSVLLAALKAPF